MKTQVEFGVMQIPASLVQFSSAAVMPNSLQPHEHAACQASLSITNSRSSLKLMSIELVMPSNHLILCHPLLLLALNLSQHQGLLQGLLFTSGGQRTRASASALALPMNIQDRFPLEVTGLISLQSKGLSRVFSNTTVQKHHFFGT